MNDEARWFLALNGQQFGPYPRSMVGEMIAAGQVRPDACHAWAEGMPGWLPLTQVPELAPLAAPPASTIAPPPPVAPPAEQERVDVNTAEADDLLVLPGMTLALAARLVHERQVRGGFRDVEQVGQALRLQPHQVERIRDRVTFGRIAASSARVVDF